MEGLAPFERAPRLAVALSGGADSSTLALLAGDWAAGRGGTLLALIVDHGLRAGSAAEAARLAERCMARGFDARVLVWTGSKPGRAVEEAARRARYRLLEDACRRHRVLHLLVGHHLADQAETVAMRREAGSGDLGLAGMSACVERPGMRLLRPFLGVAPARLRATLAARGESWLEDPMNRDRRFTRVRLRQDGVAAPDPAAAARRSRLERETAAGLAGMVRLDAGGVATLHRGRFRALPERLRLAVLARLAMTVGGLDYPPRGRRLAALAGKLDAPDPVRATLGRCLWRGAGVATVSREERNVPVVEGEGASHEVLWDGRFRVRVPDGPWRIRGGGTLPVVERPDGSPVAAGPAARFAPRQPLVPPLFLG